MILQKNRIRKIIYLFLALFAIIIVVFYLSSNSCGIQHVILTTDMKTYEKSLDPEFCEYLVEKIDIFNDRCEPKIEILDCG